MGHAGAADGFHQRFFDNSVFYVKSKFAGSLLRRTGSHAVRKRGNILDVIGLYLTPLLRNGSGTVVGTLRHGAHSFHIFGTVH